MDKRDNVTYAHQLVSRFIKSSPDNEKPRIWSVLIVIAWNSSQGKYLDKLNWKTRIYSSEYKSECFTWRKFQVTTINTDIGVFPVPARALYG